MLLHSKLTLFFNKMSIISRHDITNVFQFKLTHSLRKIDKRRLQKVESHRGKLKSLLSNNYNYISRRTLS